MRARRPSTISGDQLRSGTSEKCGLGEVLSMIVRQSPSIVSVFISLYSCDQGMSGQVVSLMWSCQGDSAQDGGGTAQMSGT